MYKKWLAAVMGCSILLNAASQTLFTYSNQAVDAKEFLRAFKKNNQTIQTGKKTTQREYLDLYIKSKLKVWEAVNRGFDTLPTIKSEMENLRNQVINTYLVDPQTEENLVKEAFQRSLKDIHAAYIFISFKNPGGNTDTAAAHQKLKNVQQRLSQGEDFLTVAQQLSDDPSAKTNKGDLGYITVFTLPYDFETAVYSAAPGKTTEPLRRNTGFFIFRNLGERKALGSMNAQQILLAFPPDADENTKKVTGQKADSLYQLIMKGEDIGKLASQFSNDYITASNNGRMSDFGVGKYEAAFENAVWAIQKDSSVSKPFMTSHGYHIVKRNSVTPVVTDPKNKSNLSEIKQKVMNDPRWKISKDIHYKFILKKIGVENYPYDKTALWDYADSVLNEKEKSKTNPVTGTSKLFRTGDSIATVTEFMTFASSNRHRNDGSGLKSYPELLEEFTEEKVFGYYRDHLEKYNDEFRYQMNEFREGNLFFEIMQQEIWNRSQIDSSALKEIYRKNKLKYTWKPSADAVIFFCADDKLCKTLRDEVKNHPSQWRAYADQQGEKVLADSARYEFYQIPAADKTPFQPGMITTSKINKDDNTASFAYILKVYPKPGQRSFEEAKGLVINDYQGVLDEKWVAELKKKYPVKVNEEVLKSISNK